ncbi:MAG: hypothetical protein J3K34DRAFT_527222 [Monoraphidium minutum]|nr:MAG: hypothetical protein J3K34DRAFT_527222 [Monoraphidium minutum]
MGDTDPETDALVWQLHRQLNDLRPRAGRAGAALTTQLSLDRARRGRPKQPGTESGSREHSRHRRRSSDGGGGGGEQHTSAQRVKKEPPETSSSGDERRHERRQGDKQARKERERPRGGDASDHGPERPAKRTKGEERQLKQVQPQQLQPQAAAAAEARQLPPAAQAAVVASEGARRRARVSAAVAAPDDAQSKGDRPLKLFLAGMRWGVSLPCSALRSRPELARSVNDAFVGEIISVGRGDDLSVVFVTVDGEAEEMPALRGGGGGGGGGARGGESASKWRRLVGKAARVYVRWGGAGPAGGAAARGGSGGGAQAALPMPHEELD